MTQNTRNYNTQRFNAVGLSLCTPVAEMHLGCFLAGLR
jgi:hypothetical protein